MSWDAVNCELSWEVSAGIIAGGQYKPSRKQTYRIDMDAALMQVGAERRGFDPQEAENVHALMDLISRYAADSTIWWEGGQGEKVDSTDRSIAGHRPAHPDPPDRRRPIRPMVTSPVAAGPNKDSPSK